MINIILPKNLKKETKNILFPICLKITNRIILFPYSMGILCKYILNIDKKDKQNIEIITFYNKILLKINLLELEIYK